MTKLFVTLHSFTAAATERLRRDERGATAVEYGLLVALIAAAVIAAVVLFGPQLALLFQNMIPTP